MAPPKKSVKRLDLRLSPELHTWLERWIPERGANAQQVAISILELAREQTDGDGIDKLVNEGVRRVLEKVDLEEMVDKAIAKVMIRYEQPRR